MADCPKTGDTVLFTMPEDWRPELGIRTYPAIVLYQTNAGERCLDLQAFTGLDPLLRYSWVKEGSSAGQWTVRA